MSDIDIHESWRSAEGQYIHSIRQELTAFAKVLAQEMTLEIHCTYDSRQRCAVFAADETLVAKVQAFGDIVSIYKLLIETDCGQIVQELLRTQFSKPIYVDYEGMSFNQVPNVKPEIILGRLK